MNNDKNLRGSSRFFLSGFKDSYLVNDIMTQGGMGIIYEATTKSGQKVVIKQAIENTKQSEGLAKKMLRKEAAILKRVVNRNIVSFMDESQDDEVYYYVMEKINGTNLFEMCSGKPMNIKEGTRIMLEICNGMKYLHDFNIIHRDLNPKNIMMDGNTPVIIDFSSAETLQSKDEVIRIKGSKIGTKIFSAPEQFNSGESSKKSDIYSMGMVYLFILTGNIPEENPDKISQYLSRKILNSKARALISQCIQMEPEERISTVNEIENALEAILKDAETANESSSNYDIDKIFIKIDGNLYEINDIITIGRKHECTNATCGDQKDLDISIDNPYVSRHHVKLRKDASGKIYAEDLGSKNGTAVSVDGGRTFNMIIHGKETEIYPGDIIALGYKHDLGPKQIIEIVGSQ